MEPQQGANKSEAEGDKVQANITKHFSFAGSSVLKRNRIKLRQPDPMTKVFSLVIFMTFTSLKEPAPDCETYSHPW